ncbi:MAG: carboxymuconolactone decarboxylase family protein [Methanomicrobiales archaeon]
MDENRFERGKIQLETMSGTGVHEMLDTLQGVAPDLARYTIEFPYGDVLCRPGLDLKSRQVATVAALTALGNAPVQLNAHISMALNVGCTREEIIEIITQMAVYAGFPAALNGMTVAKDVFADRDRKGMS